MGKAKHTPGPWWIWKEEALKNEGLTGEELTEELLDSVDHCVYAGTYADISRSSIRGGSFQHVINVNDFQDANEDPYVALANARLIAAAPELLSVLKDIVEQFEKTAFPVGCDLADSIRVFGKAVIAKAEGEEVA